MAGVAHSDGQFFSDGQGYVPGVVEEEDFPPVELEALFYWSTALKAQSYAFDPMPRSRSGGPTLSGMEQTVRSDAGIWRATLSNVVVKTTEQIRAWRTLAGQLEGRANAVVVPICDRAYSIATTGFAQMTPSLLRATTVLINVASPLDSRRQHFSIVHAGVGERLYRILSSTEVVAGVFECKIWPPIREATTVNMDANFDNARCTMRLERDDGMDIDLDQAKFGTPSVTFVEYF